MKKIVVIDGMGGGIGVQITGKLKEIVKDDIQLIALGANAVATERMVNAGASCGATGENAIKQTVRLADFIVGPIGIIIENSMMGEITRAMSSAILSSTAKHILLPIQNSHLVLAGVEPMPLARMIEKAVELVKKDL